MAKGIFTIGHSNLSIDKFIGLLQKHKIQALVDVRSSPYSRYVPHFNQSALKAALVDTGIYYIFLGEQLGARPREESCYVDGRAVYEKIAATNFFKAGIERLLRGAETYNISLMCAERDPVTCHRAILVCQHLRTSELEINHILPDGTLEPHKHLEDRLLEMHGLKKQDVSSKQASVQLSLFNTLPIQSQPEKYQIEEALKEAYKYQGYQIAYQKDRKNYDDKTSS